MFFVVAGVGRSWGGNEVRHPHPLFVVLVESASVLSSGHICVFPSFSIHVISHWKSVYSYLRSLSRISLCPRSRTFPRILGGKKWRFKLLDIFW